MKVAAIQMAHGDALAGNLARARAMLEVAAEEGAALAVLPEYWFAVPGGPQEAIAKAADVRKHLERASADLRLAVAANVVEKAGGVLRNVGLVYEDGKLALEQAKVHPMPREAAEGLQGGARLHAAPVRERVTGMLVCADILYPEAARVLSLQGAQVLLNPVMSPWREVDNTKAARDAIFIARAYDSGAFVVKAGGWRRPSGDPPLGVAGRSLIAAPWGILARYRDDFEETILYADLDFDRLAAFRKHQASFPARRPEAYGGLL